MKKFNWSCTTCGMSSSRRTSIQRHIDNQNIHNGIGQSVPFVEYSVGRRQGKYGPQQAPSFSPSRTPTGNSMVNKIEKEVENEIIKEIAKRIFNSYPKNDPFYLSLESVARKYIDSKMSKGLLRETLL